MLDFNEVGRRMGLRSSLPDKMAVPHQAIVEPLVTQLLDPGHVDETGVVLHTHVECAQLAQTLHRQAQMLDQKEAEDGARDQLLKDQNDELEKWHQQCDYLEALVNKYWWQRAWLLAGTVVALAWLSAVIVAVVIVKL